MPILDPFLVKGSVLTIEGGFAFASAIDEINGVFIIRDKLVVIPELVESFVEDPSPNAESHQLIYVELLEDSIPIGVIILLLRNERFDFEAIIHVFVFARDRLEVAVPSTRILVEKRLHHHIKSSPSTVSRPRVSKNG